MHSRVSVLVLFFTALWCGNSARGSSADTMVGSLRINERLFSLTKTSTVKKKTIIAGMKSDHSSREMLLRLLNFIVVPGDSVLAVHVQDSNDEPFDPNTFHIHEDLCKSKQVDFQVKICTGSSSSYMSELSHQVRVNFATMLAIGCGDHWPEDSTISRCLKTLPPSCTLLVINNVGKIVLQMQGTSQQGSVRRILQSSISSIEYSSSSYDNSETKFQLQKSLTMPCSSSISSPQPHQTEILKLQSTKKRLNHPDATTTSTTAHRLFKRLAALEVKGQTKRFTLEVLKFATNNFSPEMLIGKGGHSKVYRACLQLGDGHQAAAVKVLNMSEHSEEDLFGEVKILSGLKHDNIINLLGYCYCRELQAVVYNLLNASLRQRLKQLGWDYRMKIAVGVAKALDYLHSSSPPIIHRDVKSSNILLSENGQTPQLSDFGGAMVNQQASILTKPIHVVGTFGYLAPEYMMYGMVDEKIDVYSYGVVLLELITGKEAIQTKSTTHQESLVLWARSLLSNGLCDRLIDPNLKDEYNKDEMKTMIIAARLCLLHSSSRRPTMKKILHLFEEPDRWLEMQKKRDELLNISSSKDETEVCRHQESDF